ncbi:MAG: 5-formyltetrahydrofolate cyclo-ligase [Desulfuromonadales bacterium]|nr:5-formyltetrahydrofolate cyclo-ligase [Desulfuromonadales bacterium]
MPKRSLRQTLLARRRHSSQHDCLARSLKIQERLLLSAVYAAADCIALYSAVQNEVQTEEIARQAIVAGKRLVYPRVAGATLVFESVNALTELRPGAFGVAEPTQGAAVDHAAIDLLVVPAVAFDARGHRLGYGKGFYDRALAACTGRTVAVGLAYDFQLVTELPIDAHDRAVCAVMTETKTVWFSPSALHESLCAETWRPSAPL